MTLVVQWLTRCPCTAVGRISTPGWGSTFAGWKEIPRGDSLSVSGTLITTRHIELGDWVFFLQNSWKYDNCFLLSCLPKKRLSGWVNEISQIRWIKGVCRGGDGSGLLTCLLHRSLRGTEQILILVIRRTGPTVWQEEAMNSLCWRDPHLREVGGFPRVS